MFTREHPDALAGRSPTLTIHQAGGDELNSAVARAFACLASRPDGPMPMELDYPTKLLNSGTRLAATVPDYQTACALADRPGEGPASLRRRLERLTFGGPGPWRDVACDGSPGTNVV